MNTFLLAQIHHYDEYDMDYEFVEYGSDWIFQRQFLVGVWSPQKVELPKGIEIDLNKVPPKKYLFSHHISGTSNLYGKKIKFFEKPFPVHRAMERYTKEIVNVYLR